MLPSGGSGFDEFFGNLYHLNAEEGRRTRTTQRTPSSGRNSGRAAVIHSFADGRIHGHRSADPQRMETIDEEVTAKGARLQWSGRRRPTSRSSCGGTPLGMHIWTHLKPGSQGKTGLGVLPDGMVEHDGHVGQVLAKLRNWGSTRTPS